MDAVLLDTDVYSYLSKGDPRGDAYRRHIKGKTAAISFVTVGELYYWAEKRKWGAARLANFEESLRAIIIVPFDLQVCKAYATLGLLKNVDGSARTIDSNDRWIAACALRHRIPLISNNRRHFEAIPELTLISEAPTQTKPSPVRLPLSEPPEGA